MNRTDKEKNHLNRKDALQNENEFLFKLSSVIGLDSVFKEISFYIFNNYGFESALLFFPHNKNKSFTLNNIVLPDKLKKSKSKIEQIKTFSLNDNRINNKCISNNKPFLIDNFDNNGFSPISNDFIFPYLKTKTVLFLPLLIDKEIFSLLILNTHDAPVYIDEQDIDYLSGFVNKLSKFIKNASNYDNMNSGRNFLMDLIENSPVGIQVISKKGEVIITNPAFESLGIFKPYNGANIWIENENFINNNLKIVFDKALTGKLIIKEDVPVIDYKNTEKKLVNIILSPIYNNNNEIDNILLIWQDNTEKAKTQQLLKNDLRLAKKIQYSIISDNSSSIEQLDIKVYFSSKMEVGGDIYDIIEKSPGVYRFFLADATGHGVQASLTTMLIKVEYDRIRMEHSPAEILTLLNKSFCANYRKVFLHFTCAVFDFDLNNNTVKYSMAGHPPQIGIFQNSIDKISMNGSVIGIFSDAEFEELCFKINVSDKIFLFTDGVTECFSEDKRIFGMENLKQILENNISIHACKTHDKIVKHIVEWMGNSEPNDDMTLISIEYNKT